MPDRNRLERQRNKERMTLERQQCTKTDILTSQQDQILGVVLNFEEILRGEIPIGLMDLVSSRLKAQFNINKGLYPLSYIYARVCAGDELPQHELIDNFGMQIHFVNNHYVMSYEKDNEIVVLDSLWNRMRLQTLMPQLRILYQSLKSGRKSIDDIMYRHPQSQGVTVDCGPFAIANTYCVLSNQDPLTLTLNQKMLRPHIYQCLQQNNFTNFPCVLRNFIPNLPHSWRNLSKEDPVLREVVRQMSLASSHAVNTSQRRKNKEPLPEIKRKRYDRERKRNFRLSRTEIDIQQQKQIDKDRKKKSRSSLTDIEIEEQRQINSERKKSRRSLRSDIDMEEQRKTDSERKKSRRSLRSDIETEQHRRIDKEQAKARRSLRSDIDMEEQRKTDSERKKSKRSLRCEIETEQHRRIDKEQAKARRSLRSDIDMEEQRKTDSERKKSKRSLRCEIETEQHRRIDKEQAKARRSLRSDIDMEEQRKTDSERKKSKRSLRCEIETEQHRRIDKEQAKARRSLRSDIDMEEQRKTDSERKKSKRSLRCEIETEQHRRIDKEQAKARRSLRSDIDMEEQRKTDSERKKSKRSLRCEIETEQHRRIDKEQAKARRSLRSDIDMEEQRKTDSERKKSKRSLRCAIETEQHRKTDSERKNSRRVSRSKKEKENHLLKDRVRKRSRSKKTYKKHLELFKKELFSSPNFACSACHRLLYKHSVQNLKFSIYSDLTGAMQTFLENGKWICKTCHSYLKRKKIPPMAVVNKLELSPMPEELKTLTDLEARLVAQRIPFMKLMNLPKGQQRAIVGSVVNVPIDVSETCASLPRCSSSSSGFIPLKLKRKQEYNGHVQFQTVRPQAVDNALNYLKIHNPLYFDILINDSWKKNFEDDDEDLWHALTDPSVVADHDESDSQSDVVLDQSQEQKSPSPQVDVEMNDIHSSLKEERVNAEDSQCEGGENLEKYVNCESEHSDTDSESDTVSLSSLSEYEPPHEGSEDESTSQSETDEYNHHSPLANKTDGAAINSDNLAPLAFSSVNSPSSNGSVSEMPQNSNSQFSLTLDTCLQPHDVIAAGNEVFSIAPGEGRIPVGIMNDQNNEVLTFPHLFPTGKFGFDVDRPVNLPIRKYFQTRLLNKDHRFSSNTEYLFYGQYLTEFKQIHDCINIALRKARCQQGVSLCAGMLKDKSNLVDIVRKDQGYQFLQNIRGSPAYCKKVMYELLAMIRQLGPFTWFLTLSAADLRWPDTICAIAAQYNVQLSVEDVKNMSWEDRCHWVRRNPVTAARHFDHRVQLFMNHLMKHEVVGDMQDFLYRVEFQQRGSPHIHMAVWVKGAPTFETSSDTEISNFIDKYVSCFIPKDDDDLKETVLTYQRHCHTHTCQKSGKACRFSFPRPPSSETVICREAEGTTNSKETDTCESTKKKHQDLLRCVYQLMSQSDIGNLSTLDLLDQLKITPEDYMVALRGSRTTNGVIYAREPVDVFINNYNSDILTAWQANMDLQFVADPYACVMYIASYMTKAEHEMGELLKKVSSEAFDVDLHQQLKRVGKKFLNSREVSAQEAVYRLLSLPLTKSSRQVLYVPTDLDEDRTLLLKPLTVISSLEDDDEDIFQKGLVDRYQKRPDQLEEMCLAEFASEYKVSYSTSSSNNATNSSSTILLKDNAGVMTKRAKSAICRTHKYSIKKHPEKHYHSLLMLYYPWRRQQDLLHVDGTYLTKYEDVKDIVCTSRSKYEHNSTQIENAIQNLEDNGPPEDAWNILMSEGQHQRHSEREEGTSEATEHAILQPSLHAEASREVYVPSLTVTSSIQTSMLADEEYVKHLRSLNNEQRDILNIFVQWYFNLRTSRKTGNLPPPIRLFVSGFAGTGKSHLIKALYQSITRNLRCEADNPDDTTTLLLAPTGTAAHNIHGQTIHHALQLSVYRTCGSDTPSQQTLAALRTRYQSLKCIIIDEISMVGANDFYRLHRRLADIRGTEEIFGGYSLVCFGDLQQLPPVGQPPVFGLPSSPVARLYGALWDNVSIATLTQIMRQKNDSMFANLLGRIRQFDHQTDIQKQLDIDTLKTRLVDTNNVNHPVDALHVYATNADVDRHNERHLNLLKFTVFKIKAQDSERDSQTQRIKIEIPDKPNLTCGLRTEVKVALGARIMLTKNIDTSDGLVNGMQGTVVGFYPPPPSHEDSSYSPLYILTELDDPSAGQQAKQKHPGVLINHTATPIQREEVKFKVGKYQVAEVTRRQFPITLCWACTIHKVQGMTLDQIVISCRGRFNPGQFYVAISRVKSLDGLFFIDFDQKKIIMNKQAASSEALMKITRPLDPLLKWPPDPVQQKLVVTALNIRSVKAHHEDVINDQIMLSSDIIALSETWLSPKQSMSSFLLTGFETYRCDRHQCYTDRLRPSLDSKGGVLQHVSSSLFVSHVSQNEIPNIEYVTTRITIFSQSESSMSVTVVYRPPFATHNVFMNALKQILEKVESSDVSLVMGDFNLALESQPTKYKELTQVFSLHGYQHLDTAPTHISGSTIDHAFLRDTSSSVSSVSSRALPVYYSDHAALQVLLNLQ